MRAVSEVRYDELTPSKPDLVENRAVTVLGCTNQPTTDFRELESKYEQIKTSRRLSSQQIVSDQYFRYSILGKWRRTPSFSLPTP